MARPVSVPVFPNLGKKPNRTRPQSTTSEANQLSKLVEITAEFAAGAGAAEEGGNVPDFGSTQEVVENKVKEGGLIALDKKGGFSNKAGSGW